MQHKTNQKIYSIREKYSMKSGLKIIFSRNIAIKDRLFMISVFIMIFIPLIILGLIWIITFLHAKLFEYADGMLH